MNDGLSWKEELKKQYEGPDSFLGRLNPDHTWDQQGFDSLTRNMRAACEELVGSEVIDRWLADLFWETQKRVKQVVSHPNFVNKNPEFDTDTVIERLQLLAYWLFTDEPPFTTQDALNSAFGPL